MKTVASILCFLVCVFFGKAQQDESFFPPPEYPMKITATRALGAIHIDGSLDNPDWANVQRNKQILLSKTC